MKKGFLQSQILGYGEDSFTLWALKKRISKILDRLNDTSSPSDCLILYRPSFGRGDKGSAQFGEFDAILASSQNIYLIESKWDNFSEFKNGEIIIKPEQKTRHRIFSWYLMHWNKEYSNKWENFVKEQTDDFQKKFPEKKIAPTCSLLAINLQFILTMLQEHCGTFLSEHNINDVLLFFYDKRRSIPPNKISGDFELVSIDYSQDIVGNFIALD